MGATSVGAVVDAPDDDAGGDEESTEAGPNQLIEIYQFLYCSLDTLDFIVFKSKLVKMTLNEIND